MSSTTNNSFTTQLLEGDFPTLKVERAELRVLSGEAKGERLPLNINSLLIGKSRDCDLVLPDPSVSSRHARIELVDEGFLLSDLGSKNGLTVNGLRVRSLLIQPGMKFQLGSTLLQVKAKGGHDEWQLGAPRTIGGLIAHSPKMRAFATSLQGLAQSEMTVLVQGETGTGKEIAAMALHSMSTRAGGPFVVYDCGAQTPTLAASELFGVVRGAYTGADESRPGALMAAEGGTLFLDEVGELQLELQPILLRALESRESRPVGGERPRKHNVRIVAATHRNLQEQVKAGQFRQDLYYRLAAGHLRLPALRERRQDILPLAREFARIHEASLTPELISLFEGHDWPGNVRELQHMIRRAAISSEPSFVAPDLATNILPLPEARRQAGEVFEREYVERVLHETKGNVTAAAKLASVSRQLLTRLIAKHGIRDSD